MRGKMLSWGENLKSQSLEQAALWISAYLQFAVFPLLAPPPGEHSEPTTV